MAVKIGVGFILDGNEANKIDLGLKIGIFAATHFCFTKVSFS